MIRTAAILLAAGLATGPAAAQMGNPAGMGADTRMAEPGKPAPHQTNNTDRLFAQLAAAGGLAEVDLGEMARDRADAQGVRDFAEMMVRDHGDANARLAELAEAARIPLPQELDPDHQALRDRLEGADGVAFDLAYIRAQIVEHQKTAQLLAWEVDAGQDGDIQRLAADLLPVVLGHLERAQALNGELSGAGVRILP
ncbi:DUF4142 domain-containing protein [Paracoccus thiocyanatus]|uniref:DUF4142 domain-containing protein n=1 Tax=Paracoccus thiocyanatus TaxID=34006 RepID=A0A3D8P8K1_9RHOB|nr:DUF4142 domain-containing protein [Paracoccus thiocyanatus]RDW11962.1 DUF4142 domain-containing protein [Paracoccus thiocyanatus]